MRVSDDVLLLYATHDGQARRIATRIADRLVEQGIAATPQDLAAGVPAAEQLLAAPLITVVAAVRYGRHRPAAERLLAAYTRSGSVAPLIFISVSLTARKPNRNSIETNQYLRKSLSHHRVTPVLATAIPGRLDYPRYGWLDRQIIRLIMKLTGGPTDPRSCTEFTDWNVVDTVANRIAEHFRGCNPDMAAYSATLEDRT